MCLAFLGKRLTERVVNDERSGGMALAIPTSEMLGRGRYLRTHKLPTWSQCSPEILDFESVHIRYT
jgi:hypothetical protein